MAKSKSKNIKSNKKKTVNKKIEVNETTTSKELLKIFRVLFVVVVILSVFYLLTVAIVGNSNDSDKEVEAKIQYEEILAGSSFNMRDGEYLVVYYDFSDTKLTDITSQIYTYSYTGQYRLYTVDMSNGFNKPYSTVEESIKNPSSADDLLINGPTLIKFKDGKVEKYIEGASEIVDYLN